MKSFSVADDLEASHGVGMKCHRHTKYSVVVPR